MGNLQPTDAQTVNIYLIPVFLVAQLLWWFVPIVSLPLLPIKQMCVMTHEYSKILPALLLGMTIESICIDPIIGGQTRMHGRHLTAPLALGYLGNSLIGSLLIFCSFDVIVSKAVSIPLMLYFLASLYWTYAWHLILLTICWVGLLIGLWWANHGVILKYFVLFIGVAINFFVVFDVIEDFVFNRPHESSVTLISALLKRVRRGTWAILFTFIAIGYTIAFVFAALAVQAFKDDQVERGMKWLPT